MNLQVGAPALASRSQLFNAGMWVLDQRGQQKAQLQQAISSSGHAPSGLSLWVMLVFMRLSSWCRFTSSQIDVTPATASTNTSAAVEP